MSDGVHRRCEGLKVHTEVLTCCMEDEGQGMGLEVGRLRGGDCAMVGGQEGGGGVIR